MLHLLKYSFLSKIRNFNIVFWPLIFPLVLGTFFYFAFGNINEADFQTVPVAVVKEASADTFFMTYLDEVEKSSPDLLKAEEMPEKEALEALQDKKIKGIYYVGKEPSLTVAGTGMEESILQTVLDSCENTRTTITNIMKKNPEMDIETITNLLSTDSLVKEVSLGGRTIDGNMQFFGYLLVRLLVHATHEENVPALERKGGEYFFHLFDLDDFLFRVFGLLQVLDEFCQ